MKIRRLFFLYFIIFLVLIAGAFLFLPAVMAVIAPTVEFSGDDIMQNGGTDDAYDALIVIDITSIQVNPTAWDLQYSNDAGQNWNNIVANYETISANHRKYYFSTSKIYAPTLLARVRTQQSGEWTDYFQDSLSLTHRATNNGAHYFVESFDTNVFQGEIDHINWDTDSALLELASGGNNNYHPNGNVTSLDVLSGIANNNILSIQFQPVMWNFNQNNGISYQFSNNGVSWTNLLSFPGQTVPDVVTVPFNSTGDKLYWRIFLHATAPHVTPQVYQMRFNWRENTNPIACFTVNPASSQDTEQIYAFNANCSTDYEDDLNQLSFRWDFNNDGNWETAFQQGASGYIKTNNYHSTSTFVAKVEVRDTGGAVSTFTNSINEEGVEGAVSGWLWSSNYGWASLNCDNVYYGTPIRFCPPNYGWTLNADYTISGWAWDDNLGWLCIGSTCRAYGLTPDEDFAQAVYSRDSGQVVGWAKYLNFNQSGWLKLRGDWCGDLENDMCVRVDMSSRSLEGFGWAGGRSDSGAAIGPGWVQFGGSLNVPWLETKYGAIYSRARAGSSNTAIAPEGRYNSSYCILASGDIANLSSGLGCSEAGYNDFGFPNSSNKYKTISGLIDFDSILNGDEVARQIADVDGNLPKVLAGKVYNFSGDGLDNFIIDAPLTFFNAKNLNSSGAGTIVINGDLRINSNLYYEGNAVSGKISNLASVAWIVKGDLFIDPAVNNLAGNFIVLGRPGVGCPNAGCGRILTGDDSANPKQLVVNGLIMAKEFQFQRFYKAAGEPAEKIIYDGRVLVNTPPGLTDVANGLPVWREALPTNTVE